MTTRRIRVLVVEDSLTVRKHLCEVLASDAEIEMAGEAEDGKTAIEMCRELRPDVITMDMMLPVMSGLACTEYIMAHSPTPILVVSSSKNRGELFHTYEALSAGAVDVLEKPDGGESHTEWERRFVSTVKLVSRIRVITHPRARLRICDGTQQIDRTTPQPSSSRAPCRVVVVGASTGGPAAIVDLLRALPAGFHLPLVLVLHIGEPFGAALADWLDGQTRWRIGFAKDGDALVSAASRVAIAAPDCHLSVQNGRFRLTRDPARHSCRPSIDVLFESIAREFGAASAACLLTGMGRDGAAGLLAIRRAGGLTIAQDEATSVVYGMPREAVLLDAAERVLPLHEIGSAIASLGAVPSPYEGTQ